MNTTRTKKTQTTKKSDAKRMIKALRVKRNKVLQFKRNRAADAITRQWADGKIAGINVAIRMLKSFV